MFAVFLGYGVAKNASVLLFVVLFFLSLVVKCSLAVQIRRNEEAEQAEPEPPITQQSTPVIAPSFNVKVHGLGNSNQDPKPEQKAKASQMQIKTFMAQKSYVAFDLETTGLSAEEDEIIEIGAVKVFNGVIIERYGQLVKPHCSVPAGATKVNHITDDMLKDKPHVSSVLPVFLNFVGNLPLIAHNARFDISFLQTAAEECGIETNFRYMDSMKFAQYWPGLENKKLATMAKAVGYKSPNAHRAESDAETVFIITECTRRIMNGPEPVQEPTGTRRRRQ